MSYLNQKVAMEHFQNKEVHSLQNKEFVNNMKWKEGSENIGETIPYSEEQRYRTQNPQQQYRDRAYFTQGEEERESLFEERAFKKIKSTQLNKLNQLRHEYQILKNIKIDDTDLYSSKTSNKISDSSSLVSDRSDILANKKSKSQVKKKVAKKFHAVEYYQKQQLELLVNQSMKRIEELLQNQIIYKKSIHELTRKLQDLEEEISNSNHHRKSEEAEEKNRALKIQIEKLKFLNQEITEKNKKMEDELKSIDKNYKKVQQQKLILEGNALKVRQKLMNDEIALKKIKMEYEMLQKEKQIEIKRLKTTLMAEAKNPFSDSQANLWKLEEQLKEKNKENENLQKQISIMKIQIAQHQQIKQQYIKEQGQIFDKLLSKIENVDHRDDAKVRNQIESLKQQIQQMKHESIGYDERQILENKIYSLEKIIEDENIEKMKFMEQLRAMTEDYANLSLKYKKIKEKIHHLEEENQQLKSEISASEHSNNISMTSSNVQYNNIIMKVKALEGYQKQNQSLKSRLNIVEKKSLQIMREEEQRISQIKKRADQKDIQVEKLKKQHIFNLQIVEKKYQTELNLLNFAKERSQRERDEWKLQFENIKKFYEAKNMELRTQIQEASNQYQEKLKVRQNEHNLLRNHSQTQLQTLRRQHQSQHQSLLNRLNSLTNSNQHYVEQASKYIHLQSELYELREKNKKNISLNQNIQHLWQVKEIQYQNLNEILKTINLAES